MWHGYQPNYIHWRQLQLAQHLDHGLDEARLFTVAGTKTSPSTDIWSLGVTWIELFTEKDAWSVDDQLNAVLMIMEEVRKNNSPLKDESDISPEVMVLLKRCVDYDKTARPTAEKNIRDMS